MVDQSSRRHQMPVAVFNARKRANVIFDPSTLPRRRRHAFGKLDRFVAHRGSIGPTKAGGHSAACVMTVELKYSPRVAGRARLS